MSVISSSELIVRAKEIVTNRVFEGLLLYGGTVQFTANTSYSSLTQYEVPTTAGGYSRLEFTFDDQNILETSTGASTQTRYLTWVHDGSATPIEFDTILIVEKKFAQPLNNYYVVATHSLGLKYTLADAGDRARFAFRFNVKDK
jgi:hypothetical protein